VLKCHHQSGLRALDGTKLLIPAYRKHKRWKEKNARSRQRYRKSNQHFFKPATKISNTVLHNWCYGNRHFTQLPHLLRSLRTTQQLNEWKDQYTAQSVANHLDVFRCSLESKTVPCNHSGSFKSTPLVWDTGTSLGLTPYRADFIDYLEVNIPVKDVTKMNYVVGIGTVIFRFQNDKGEDVFLPCVAYHLPTADIFLFSPQTYLHMHDFSSTITGKQVVMHLKEHNIVIPIDTGPSNLHGLESCSLC
jgi:hypothetical protein